MVTPDEIENRVFSLVRRGYDPAEVDDFLKEVAAELSRAQGGLATPPPAPEEAAAPLAAPAPEAAPDFGNVGEEIAKILQQAHQSVAELRHRAEAEAALTRQNAQDEVSRLKADADHDRQAAAIELEQARARAAEILADAQAQQDAAAANAQLAAQAKVDEVVARARVDARDAVLVQRNVRGRLQGARGDIDSALGRLVEEDTDLFGTIDLTDTAVADAGGPVVEPPVEVVADVPPPGQGPPSPPVPPPARPASVLDDLPYDEEEPADEPTVIDLTGDEDDDPDPDPFPAPPEPPAPLDDDSGAAAEIPDAPASGDEEEDGLAQMVKDAVENALRRRKGDAEPPENGA